MNLLNLSSWARLIFEQSTAGLNSAFFFLGYLIMGKVPCQGYYLLIAEGGRKDSFMPFIRVCSLSRIWTWITNSISHYNYYYFKDIYPCLPPGRIWHKFFLQIQRFKDPVGDRVGVELLFNSVEFGVPKQLPVEFQTVETRCGREGRTQPRGHSENPRCSCQQTSRQ